MGVGPGGTGRSYLLRDLLFPSRLRCVIISSCSVGVTSFLGVSAPSGRVLCPLECPAWCCPGWGGRDGGAPEPGLGGRGGPGRKRQPGVSSGWASLSLAGLAASLERNFPATSYLRLPCGAWHWGMGSALHSQDLIHSRGKRRLHLDLGAFICGEETALSHEVSGSGSSLQGRERRE